MLEYGQVVDGLKARAEKFQQEYNQKDYLSAMWTYNHALTIAVFMKLEEEDIKMLFGNRAYIDEQTEEVCEGLFPESQVERARLWCIRNDKTRQEVVDTRYTRLPGTKK